MSRIHSNNFCQFSINDIIFSHKFAKAFWGEEQVCNRFGLTEQQAKEKIGTSGFPIDYKWNNLSFAWGYHLQRMVLCEEPLDYLKKFLELK